ncbi:MAG: sulfite exporter TauE/SafE family protein [Clostridia bacterium]|nr:sulfite exporter TauE/SafE family protein [Clostridia bacterium]
MEGFFLGIASGTVCLATCSPLLVPYFLGEGKNVKGNIIKLLQFLMGRLVGYIIFAVLAWITSVVFIKAFLDSKLFFGLLYIVFAVLMFLYSVSKPHPVCSAKRIKQGFLKELLAKYPLILPLVLGLLTGINLCPPFLIAFTEAVQDGTLAYCILFFILFFAGTSIYFLPLPIIGVFYKKQKLQDIGKLASSVMGIYYVYKGVTTIIGKMG